MIPSQKCVSTTTNNLLHIIIYSLIGSSTGDHATSGLEQQTTSLQRTQPKVISMSLCVIVTCTLLIRYKWCKARNKKLCHGDLWSLWSTKIFTLLLFWSVTTDLISLERRIKISRVRILNARAFALRMLTSSRWPDPLLYVWFVRINETKIWQKFDPQVIPNWRDYKIKWGKMKLHLMVAKFSEVKTAFSV